MPRSPEIRLAPTASPPQFPEHLNGVNGGGREAETSTNCMASQCPPHFFVCIAATASVALVPHFVGFSVRSCYEKGVLLSVCLSVRPRPFVCNRCAWWRQNRPHRKCYQRFNVKISDPSELLQPLFRPEVAACLFD